MSELEQIIEHSFELKDADGNLHEYRVVPHKATDGFQVTLRLIALGAEPLGRLADSVFSGQGDVSLNMIMDDASVVEGLAFAAVGADLSRGILSSAMNVPALVRGILKNTLRDGKPLDKDLNFNDAFSRNYLELMLAVYEVVKVNRFLPLSAISGLAGIK